MTDASLRPASGGAYSSLERVKDALRERGSRIVAAGPHAFQAHCPVHEDRTPSLHVSWMSGQHGGATLLYCHGCQARAQEIVESLGLSMADLFDEPLPVRERRFWRTGKSQDHRQAGRRRGKLGRLPAVIASDTDQVTEPDHQFSEVQRYIYSTADGQVVSYKIREECAEGHDRHKRFWQSYVGKDGREIRRKPPGFQPVLYRAPEVDQALQAGIPVWIVEGEKDVHTAEALGLVATTNADGGKTFPDEFAELFAGAEVHVVLDRDPTGWARGEDLHTKLSAAGARVMLHLPAVEVRKADLTDHVEAGLGVQDLRAVRVEEVRAWNALSAVQAKAAAVQQACDQALVRQRLAEAGDHPEDNLRFARRWVLESEIRQEACKALADVVWAHGLQAGSLWAGEAMNTASALLHDATVAARDLHLDFQVPIPPSLQTVPRQPDGIPADDVDDQGVPDDPPSVGGPIGAPTSSPVFQEIAGQIAQFQQGRDDAGTWKVLLNTRLRVVAMEWVDPNTDTDDEPVPTDGRDDDAVIVAPGVYSGPVTKPKQLVSVRLSYPDPMTGEWMQVRVSADSWADNSYLNVLPSRVRASDGSAELVPVDYERTRGGLDRLRRAILAVSKDVEDTVIYTRMGWYTSPVDPAQKGWLHARGLTTSQGQVAVNVSLDGGARRFNLTNPVFDAGELRTLAVRQLFTTLQRMPTRVIAPLYGHIYQSVIEPTPYSLVLVGLPGSFKSTLAGHAMNHYGETWAPKTALDSGSGQGSTSNYLRKSLHKVAYAPAWIDDFNQDMGVETCQKLLDQLARIIFNRIHRGRLTRDHRQSDEEPPRSSGLFTSEVEPRPGSGSERMFLVKLNPGDIDTADLNRLDDPASRRERTTLMSSFIAWLAGDYDERKRDYLAQAREYARTLTAIYGYTNRQAESVSLLWIGWMAMGDFLVQRQAITSEERARMLDLVEQGLVEAVDLTQDPDQSSTVGDLAVAQLRFALANGLAYAEDSRSGACPQPLTLARQLGWRADSRDSAARLVPGGARLGYVRHDPQPERGEDPEPLLICLDGQAVMAVLKAAGTATGERINADQKTVLRALYEMGVLKAEVSGAKVRFTTYVNVPAEQGRSRKVVLYLDKVFGTDDEPDDDGWASDDQAPAGGGPHPVALPDDDTYGRPDTDSGPEPPGYQEPTMPAPTVLPAQSSSPVVPEETPVEPSSPQPEPQPQATPAPQAAAKPTTGFRAAAAVVDVDTIYLSNGETVPMPGEGPRHVGDLVKLAEWLHLGTQTSKWASDAGQVWVTAGLAEAMGIPVAAIDEAGLSAKTEVTRKVTADSVAVSAAVAEGYQLGRGGDGLGPWTRVWKGSAKSIWVVLIPALAGDQQVRLLADSPEPAALARRIGLLAGALGMPYHLNAASTGLDLMTALRRKDRDRMFVVHEPCPPAQRGALEADFSWCRPPTEQEQTHEWVHAYDRSGSYLAGVSGLELPVGEPTHHPDGTAFVPRMPGYWRIEIPQAADWRFPHPLDPLGKNAGLDRWVTTPALDYAVELGYDPQILEAYTWADHARVLDPWYERIRDARTALDVDDPDSQAARDQLKEVYASAIGKMGSERLMSGRAEYYPERRHMIVAKARTNVLRRVVKIGQDSGRWPVAVNTDTIVYTSDNPDPVASWPGGAQWLGRALGRYKVEGSAPLATQLPFLTGGSYRGKDDLLGWASEDV